MMRITANDWKNMELSQIMGIIDTFNDHPLLQMALDMPDGANGDWYIVLELKKLVNKIVTRDDFERGKI